MLDSLFRVIEQHKRHQSFSSIFATENGLCFCHNVNGFGSIGIPSVPNDWRLFIDSSSKNLKAVLLHNKNRHPSIFLAHSVHLKENYAITKTLLIALKYDKFNWQIIEDFKMVAFLVGSKVDLRNFHVTIVIGIVETPSFLLGKATSNGTL